ncbi:MAG: hypothetical protein OSB38_30485 [Paraburkholderia fungorum]|nr:hypothetical protein [Paraburkholderia fungorum]
MTLKPPPVDWDRHAQLVARSIAGLDRTRLSGGKKQFTAIIHEAIVDAMMMAAESNTPRAAVVAAVSQTSAPVEHGTTVKPGLGKPEAVLADLQDIRGAIAEFRAQRRVSYPHEVVAMLIEAFEQMADVVERVLPTCEKSQTEASHQWNEEGECCVICGDKDWFAGSFCKGRVSC